MSYLRLPPFLPFGFREERLPKERRKKQEAHRQLEG
jgi:hypothetical protein